MVAATASPQCLPHQMLFWKKLLNATWRFIWGHLRSDSACVYLCECVRQMRSVTVLSPKRDQSSYFTIFALIFDCSAPTFKLKKKKKITAKATKKMRSVIKKSSPGRAARRKLGNMLLYCTHDISFPLFDFFGGAGWGWETNTGITWLCFTPYSNSESNRLLKQGDTRTEQRLLHIKPHDSTIKGRKIKHSQILVHR